MSGFAAKPKGEENIPEVTVDLKGTENFNYDEWLEFFRKIPGGAGAIIDGIDYIKRHANSDGYAAARRWLEIFDEPSRMDKLYKGRLNKQLEEQEESIMDIAIGDDDEKFYEALIRQNTTQLSSSNISQQEVARLSQNINIFRKELREIRSRKTKAGSVLDKVLTAANKPIKKKPVKKLIVETSVKKSVPKKPAKKLTKTSKKAEVKTPVKTARGKKNGK